MTDTVFRERQADIPKEEVRAISKNDPAPGIVNDVETPYLDTPEFLDNYFGIGTEWHDQDASFYPEVEKIDSYIKSKIRSGEIANNQKDVTQFIKGMEKMNNLKNESRSVVKLEVLANYVDFLMKNEQLKSNLKRYAN